MQIVIIGAGQAGMQAALSLRDGGFEGNLILIGEEQYLPYQRPPLSKAYMQGLMEEEKLYLRKADFYQTKNINLRLGMRVVGLDIAAKSIEIQKTSHEDGQGQDSGEIISYDKLILATGATPFRLPVEGKDLPHVHVLRNIDDIKAIQKATAIKPKNIGIIGGGFIGLEAAASFNKMGFKVSVVTNARLMERAICEEMSEFFDSLHRAHDVDIHYISDIDKITAEAVIADGKNFSADFVIMGVGVRSNIELAERAGLALHQGGILTNDFGLCDGQSDIYAVGDCACFPLSWADDFVMRLESVQNATDMPKNVALHILQGEQASQKLPWFWSDQYDCKLQIAGISMGADRVILRGDRVSKSFSYFYVKQGVLIAVDSVNQGKDHLIAKRLITAHVKIDNPAILQDLNFDLKNLLPA